MLLVFRPRVGTPPVEKPSEWARRRMIVRGDDGWKIVLKPGERYYI